MVSKVPRVDKSKKAKGWFCTWPKCGETQEMCLECMKEKFNVIEYVICRETHKDESMHLHAFLKLDKRVYFRADLFDFNGYHGHYEIAKSWSAVQKYVKKDGDFITNIDVNAAMKKKSKGVKEKNAILLNKPPRELVDDGDISLMMLPQLLKAKRMYNMCEKPDKHIPRKCYWIWGPPRVGKSYVVRELFEDVYEKSQNKWWDNYCGEDVVLIDDMDKHGECLGHLLKIWADNYRFLAETKGDTVYPTYTMLIVTSNYEISKIFNDSEICSAIMCRFTVLNLVNRFGQDVVRKILKDKS